MRAITRHIIHASASPNSMDIGAKEIRTWHLQRGFNDIGYHIVVRRDGKLEWGRPFHKIGAHVAGHNSDSLGSCLVGSGLKISDFTPEQMSTLRCVDMELRFRFPDITTHGHREYANKSCPGFDMKEMAWTVESADINNWEYVREFFEGKYPKNTMKDI